MRIARHRCFRDGLAGQAILLDAAVAFCPTRCELPAMLLLIRMQAGGERMEPNGVKRIANRSRQAE